MMLWLFALSLPEIAVPAFGSGSIMMKMHVVGVPGACGEWGLPGASLLHRQFLAFLILATVSAHFCSRSAHVLYHLLLVLFRHPLLVAQWMLFPIVKIHVLSAFRVDLML